MVNLPRNHATFSRADVAPYFDNLPVEFEECMFRDRELEALAEIKMLSRFLDRRSRRFFLYHFGGIIEKAVRAIFAGGDHPTVLELGCGSGSMSLLLALLGARVVGVDLDPDLVSACRKRQAFYERRSGSLSLRFECANAFDYLGQSEPPLDAIYSMFAFNLMQPTGRLLEAIRPSLKAGGVLVVSDGNPASLYNRVFRRRPTLTPAQLGSALLETGFMPVETTYQCILPAWLCRWEPVVHLGTAGERAVESLGLMGRLGVSYNLIARAL